MTTNNWEPTGENVFGAAPLPATPTDLTWTKVGNVKGPEGDASTVPGPPNVLTVGSVSTGEPGSDVVVEILGDSPNQQVYFTIPRGDKGEVGADGRTAYQVAAANGYSGTEAEWLDSLIGLSAYEVALQDGFAGTEQEWLDSLIGESAYEVAVRLGYSGTETEWVASLKGEKGDPGDRGIPGPPPTLTFSGITTLAPGDSATATFTGGEGSYDLALGIPKGDPGQQGDPGDKGDPGDQNVVLLEAGETVPQYEARTGKTVLHGSIIYQKAT